MFRHGSFYFNFFRTQSQNGSLIIEDRSRRAYIPVEIEFLPLFPPIIDPELELEWTHKNLHEFPADRT